MALGAIACCYALYYLPFGKLDFNFVVIAVFTIAFGSRLSLQVPRSKVHFTMGDALVFLTFLIYGAEAATLLAAVEAFSASMVMKRKGRTVTYTTVFSNAAMMACSITTAWLAVQLFPLFSSETFDKNSFFSFLLFLGIISLTQFVTNTVLASLGDALKTGTNIWQVWNEKCVGGSLACFFGAAVAGTMYQLMQFNRILTLVIAGAVIGLIYWTYNRYLRRIEESQKRVEETERLRAEENKNYIGELEGHVAEQKRISADLQLSKAAFQHAALHDALTGLTNRAALIEQVKFLLKRFKQSDDNGFCVLFMDLDGFKKINDSLGHAVGDKLLIEVARLLEKTVRQGDMVTRLGGDEFAIVFGDISESSDANVFAERIRSAFMPAFCIDGHQIFASPSIGIALSNHEYDSPEDLLRDADIAMYNAKENKLGCSTFDLELRVRAVNRIKLETDLRQALGRNEFRVFYQPIISLESGYLIGFEALMRWQHPERGLVSPLEFIPVAESNGLIVPMTNWILMEACSQLSRWRWRSVLNRSLLMSINLSGKHFTQPDLVETVKSTLQETGLEAHCLKLEITESAVMENAEDATHTLKNLRAIGVQLSIDDFGTGYSSLSYLHKFPIDTLKIDRSFVSRMKPEGEDSEIVKTIVTLAQNLGLDVIAEGVETPAQIEQLREMGCRYAQGFTFSRPLPQAEIDELINVKRMWLPNGVEPTVNHAASSGYGKVVSLTSRFNQQ